MTDHVHSMVANAYGYLAHAHTQVWVVGAAVETLFSMATSTRSSESILEPDT